MELLKKSVLVALYVCILPVALIVIFFSIGGLLFILLYQWATNYMGDNFTTFMLGIAGEIIWLFIVVYMARLLGHF